MLRNINILEDYLPNDEIYRKLLAQKINLEEELNKIKDRENFYLCTLREKNQHLEKLEEIILAQKIRIQDLEEQNKSLSCEVNNIYRQDVRELNKSIRTRVPMRFFPTRVGLPGIIEYKKHTSTN